MESTPILDQMVSGENIRIMKAALPYLPPQGQRLLSVMAKIMELENTLTIFHHSSAEDMCICSAPASVNPVDMLKDIQAQCSEATKERIDQIINVYVMLQIIELSQESST
ncbi:MAG: hypothetical protein ACOYBL_11415 [Lachnospiraceae bacterium]|jgi:hypothetical protein